MAASWIDSPEELKRDRPTDRTIVVLPLGATEQHGPHLPLETDSMIAQRVCEELVNAIENDWDVPEPKSGPLDIRVLPVETIGYSPEHLDYEGTISLSFDDAIYRWIGIGEECANRGVKRFLMMNAHGGNSPLMTIVAQELRVRRSMLAVATSWTRFLKDKSWFDADELAYGIHGGQVETSAMLGINRDLVDMSKAKDFPNLQRDLVNRFNYLRAYGPHAFGWKAADLNPYGVTGNAKKAEASLILMNVAEEMCELLNDVADFDLAWLKDA